MKLIWTLFIIGNVIYLFQIPYLSKILLSVGSILGGRINALIYFIWQILILGLVLVLLLAISKGRSHLYY